MNNFKIRLVVAAVLACSGTAIAQTRTHSALFGEVIEYPTTGCGGAVVQTPLPGKQFAAQSLATPAWVASFYGQAAARKVTWLKSIHCVHTGRTHALVPAPAPAPVDIERTAISNGYVSQNWSGFQISNTARYTQAGWTVPTVVRPHPGYSGTGYYSSTWTGIGGGVGAGSGPLIQSGSTQDINSSGVASYYFWYEIVGGPTDTFGEVALPSGSCAQCLTAHAGDVAGSVSIWEPNAGNQNLGAVQLGVCNFTVGRCVTVTIGDNVQNTNLTSSPGNSTEWIVESPSYGYTILPLPNFDSVTFIGNCWSADYANGTGTCYPISQGTYPSSIVIQRTVFGLLQVIAAPTPLNGDGSFTDYYYQPERGD